MKIKNKKIKEHSILMPTDPSRRINNLSRTGFTLVEIVVALCIFSFISLSAAGAFFSGIKLWERANSGAGNVSELALGYARISKDIHQSFVVADVPFVGKSEVCEFLTLRSKNIVKVVYSLDKATDNFIVRKISYADVLSGNEDRYSEQVLFKVEKIEFSYYVFDINKKEYGWRDNIDQKREIPSIVKIIFERNGVVSEKQFIIPAKFSLL